MNNFHIAVLLKEVIELLKIKPKEKYIDATLGGGGHTKAILNSGGVVLGIDTDEDAIAYVQDNLQNDNLILAKGNFRELEKIAHLNNFIKISGVLFDLGVSSYQLDTAKKGFSFLREGPLDMRMDKNSPIDAQYLINLLGREELTKIFQSFGEESRARIIAKQIVESRKAKAITTTKELSDVIQKAFGIRGEISDFTKNKINQKVFQALRIAVNNEFENLKLALPQAHSILRSGGRIAVISFHSGEDRIVKETFIEFEKQDMGKIITKKPVIAQIEELETNSRAKSAKLRVFEKN